MKTVSVSVQIIASLQLLLLLHVGIMILGASGMVSVARAAATSTSEPMLQDIASKSENLIIHSRIGDHLDNLAHHHDREYVRKIRIRNLDHGRKLVKTKEMLQAASTILQPAATSSVEAAGSNPTGAAVVPCEQPQTTCQAHDEIICYIRDSIVVFARPGCSCLPLHQCSLPLYNCWLYLHNQLPIFCGF